MSKLSRQTGATSQILQVFIRDSSSTTGAGLTGLVYNSAGLTAYYNRDTDSAATAISLVTMTAGTFTSSGFKEIDATNMPGWYQFCPPNACFASGATSVGIHLKGATNMAPLPIEIDLKADVNVTRWQGTAPSNLLNVGGQELVQVNLEAIEGYPEPVDNLAAYFNGTSGYGNLLQAGAIDTLTSQTSFTLTLGSEDDDAYNGCRIVIRDQALSTQKCIGTISDYVGSTKTVTMSADPGIFTYAAGDLFYILADTDSGGSAPTAAEVADAVWDEALSGHLSAGSTGETLSAIAGYLDTEVAAIKAKTDNLPSDPADQSAVEAAITAATSSLATAASIAALNNLSAAQVNAEVDAALADINLDHLVKSAVDTDFATTVHLNSVIGHLADNGTSASFSRTTDSLEALRDRGDAAWITATGFSTHSAADVWLVGTLDSTIRAAVGLASANLDTQLGSLATSSALATVATYIDTEVAAIKAVTDAIGATGSGLSAIPWNSSWDAEIQSEVQDALEANNLDHLAKLAVDTDFNTTVHQNSVIGHLASTANTYDRSTDSLEAIRNRGDSAWTTGSSLTQADIRSAVGLASANLDTQLADLPTVAEFEARTILAANYATAANLATVATYIDTEVAAIKAKTDNLPSDPADASDIAASFSTVNSTLSTIAGYLDTEVAAIKAKTDNLPASPAAVGSAMTLDMTQAIGNSQTDGTVGAALLGMEAQAVGKWTIVGTTLTLYRRDGTTVVRTFTLDSASNPTSRT